MKKRKKIIKGGRKINKTSEEKEVGLGKEEKDRNVTNDRAFIEYIEPSSCKSHEKVTPATSLITDKAWWQCECSDW